MRGVPNIFNPESDSREIGWPRGGGVPGAVLEVWD